MPPLSIERLDGLEARLNYQTECAGSEDAYVDNWPAEDIRSLIAMARSAAWRTDMENAPRDGTWILLGGCEFGHQLRVARWSYWPHQGYDWGDYSERGFEPTHWRPITPPGSSS